MSVGMRMRAPRPSSLTSCLPALLAPLLRSAIVGEVDEDKDTAIDFAAVRAEPLKSVVH